MSTVTRPLHYLKEGVFRKWLSDLYVALVSSTENAEMIANCGPDDYNFSKIGGNEIARECMRNACLWLQWIRPFVKNERMYEDQFLNPAKIAAEYILKIRETKPTTSVKGWVFSKSEPYDDTRFGIERTTLSMVVPVLKTIMSLRARTEESEKIVHGVYEFGEVQPVPLVNRIHQFHPKIMKTNETVSLRDYNFLKVAFEDFEKFSDSIEMSNFCEIDSVQSGLRHHLGSAFVVPCRIVKSRQPRITIQGINSNTTKTVVMSDQLLRNYDYGFLDSLKDKTGRIFAVQWYDPGAESGLSKNTEVMAIELDGVSSNLRMDELVGYVRMRSEVSLKSLSVMFPGIDVSTIPILEVKDGLVNFRIYENTGDSVIDEFLKSVQKLRRLRAPSRNEECIQLNYFDVVDSDKISTLGLANLVKKDRTMLMILEAVLMNEDKKGEDSTSLEIALVTSIDEDEIARKVSWLSHLELIEQMNKKFKVTAKGKKVASVSLKNDIREKIQSENNIISIPEFKTDIPSSLLCEYLDRPESGFIPVVINGQKNKLFWAKTDSGEVNKIFQDKFDFMMSELLMVMRTTNHPFTTMKAVEELSKIKSQTDFFCSEIIVRELARKGILIPSGESWEYPLEKRIFYFLKDNPDGVYSVSHIISSLSVALMDKDNVMTILKDLESQGEVSKILSDEWSLKVNEVGKSEKRIYDILCRKTFLILKSKRGGLDERILLGMINRMAYDLCKNNKFLDRNKVARETLSILVKKNIVSLKEGLYKINN
jgi:hypothetical protein